ncbi:T-cell activation Rho GTPase-activating protein-like [Willisornis vidua]|uniref:T-cell activation Rho GTPase-activating protein-like n=1 Tax=Willisornis vidua TaxID=1566151 RepID=A0ABQ9DFD8_9PASS|nr:T-cell activation Rho GTPase-activating protein-like [Willisornis vidua]
MLRLLLLVGSCWQPSVLQGCSPSAACFLQADPKQGPAMAPAGNRGRLCYSLAGGTSRSSSRRRWLPWLFALWESPCATAQVPGQVGSGCSRALFGQALTAFCGEDSTLPQPIQELLVVLHQQGLATENTFRRRYSMTALQDLWKALNQGADINMGSQSALLLAITLEASAPG